MIRRLLLIVVLLVALAGLYVAGAWYGLYGRPEGAGTPTDATIPAAVVGERTSEQRSAAAALSVVPPDKQILFGDLHVHTTFSSDAFLASLPMLQGEGAHPVADACDYARFCSSLDFWSLNDHAEASTPRRWVETKEAIRQCNARRRRRRESRRRRVPRLGVEPGRRDAGGALRTQERGAARDAPTTPCPRARSAPRDSRPMRSATPARPSRGCCRSRDFAHRQRYWDFITFLDEIGAVPRCADGVPTTQLARRLLRVGRHARAICSASSRVGRRGDRDSARQHVGLLLAAGHHLGQAAHRGAERPVAAVPDRGDVGHGNSEEYRDWHEIEYDASGKPSCPAPSPDYLPSCWRAGEIIEARCSASRPRRRRVREARRGGAAELHRGGRRRPPIGARRARR